MTDFPKVYGYILVCVYSRSAFVMFVCFKCSYGSVHHKFSESSILCCTLLDSSGQFDVS